MVHITCTWYSVYRSRGRYILWGTFGSTRRVCVHNMYTCKNSITKDSFVKYIHIIHTARHLTSPNTQQQQQDPRLQTFSWTTYEHLQLAAPPTLPWTFHPYWHSLDFSTFHLLFDDRHNNIFLNIFCNNTSLALVPLGSFFFRMFVIRDTCRL